MRYFIILPIVLLIYVIVSCNTEDDYINNLSFEKIDGYVQKGPYVIGSSITLSELSADLTQTGKTYSSQILDNNGSFEIKGIELVSSFVELKVDGFYYNEILGESSIAPLTLYALTDLNEKENVNVNVLSHLERRRVQYLISNGMAFSDAKKQVQQEILAIFEIEKEDIPESEMLDISQEGDDHAILLAVSLILQGYRSTADLSELLATISEDIMEDGVLSNDTVGTTLVNHSKYLNMQSIRENLEDRYGALGLDVTIPDFEKYVNGFIENTSFEYTEFIVYPKSRNNLPNILHPSTEVIQKDFWYSMTAELPYGTSLKIRLSGAKWGLVFGSPPLQNWTYESYDSENNSQVFESIEPGKKCDLTIRISKTKITNYLVVEYFVNHSENPTSIKEIFIAGFDPSDSYNFPQYGRFGDNILHPEKDTLTVNQNYSMTVVLSPYNTMEVILTGGTWETEQHESGSFNWTVSPYNTETKSQTFSSSAISDTCDLGVTFTQTAAVDIQYSDEHSGEPAQTKTIYIVDF